MIELQHIWYDRQDSTILPKISLPLVYIPCKIPGTGKTTDLTLKVTLCLVTLIESHPIFESRRVFFPGVEKGSQRHILQMAWKKTNTHVENC